MPLCIRYRCPHAAAPCMHGAAPHSLQALGAATAPLAAAAVVVAPARASASTTARTARAVGEALGLLGGSSL